VYLSNQLLVNAHKEQVSLEIKFFKIKISISIILVDIVLIFLINVEKSRIFHSENKKFSHVEKIENFFTSKISDFTC